MPQEQLRITFQPSGRSVYVLPGTLLLEAAGRAGFVLDTPCGGAGTCGKCRARLIAGAPAPTGEDARHLPPEQLEEGWRLACRTVLAADATVELPASSLFAEAHQILANAHTAGAQAPTPQVTRKYVELPPPTLDDAAGDFERLARATGATRADLDVLQALPAKLREGGFRGTAMLAGDRLLDFTPQDTSGRCLGVAFDVGTTTLVGSLLDLSSGEELALAARVNAQVRYGDDVLSRIEYARSGVDAAGTLRRSVIEALNGLLAELCQTAGARAEEICDVVLAGNTTMQHLLAGLSVGQLGEVPFPPVTSGPLEVQAGQLGLEVHPRALCWLLPVVGGFVGGDIVAGLLATELDQRQGAALLVDIGTNGEIVLARDGELLAASTAAGPAFEGARIACGMRASPGAIEKAVFNEDLHLSVIGNAAPAGLCGSALIDLAAEMLRSGILTPEGRLCTAEELPPALPAPLRGRVRKGPGGQGELLLSEPPVAARVVALTQRDIRELQLACGAIRAGIEVLLEEGRVAPEDLSAVFVAGGFGSYIRPANARRLGLLPRAVEPSRFHYVGNASLNGARWALLSVQARRRAEEIARSTRHVELAQQPAFMMAFAEAMIFPED